MGFFSALQQFLGVGKRTVNIVVVGLDNSGKTTILNSLRSEETRVSQVIPTVGMNVTTFSHPSINFSAWDMSGQSEYRNLWESYYAKTEGIIFVVDSGDRLRLSVARDELWMIIDNRETRKCPILIMANKSDLQDAAGAGEISTLLGLDMMRGRPWHICSTSAVTGTGIPTAMEWLSQNVKDFLDGKVVA